MSRSRNSAPGRMVDEFTQEAKAFYLRVLADGKDAANLKLRPAAANLQRLYAEALRCPIRDHDAEVDAAEAAVEAAYKAAGHDDATSTTPLHRLWGTFASWQTDPRFIETEEYLAADEQVGLWADEAYGLPDEGQEVDVEAEAEFKRWVARRDALQEAAILRDAALSAAYLRLEAAENATPKWKAKSLRQLRQVQAQIEVLLEEALTRRAAAEKAAGVG